MQKRLYTILTTIAVLLLLSGCKKFTNIVPKGKALIRTADDLERLANKQYNGSAFTFRNGSILINEQYPQAVNIPGLINGTTKNLNYVLMRYDETIDRAALAVTDGTYDGLYSIINNVANMLINQPDDVTGDAQVLKSLKAEGYIIRAFMHYYLINIYAKAYDPATAGADGGVPYVTDMDFGQINPKKTVKEVYDNILSDINAAFDLNALPDNPKNKMRVGKAFAFAVKARVLLTMRDYPGALLAANSALALNSVLEDHRPLLYPPNGTRVPFLGFRNGLNAVDNIFYAYSASTWPFLLSPTYEIVNQFYEPGNIFKDSLGTTVYRTTNSVSLTGLPEFVGGYPQNSGGVTTSDLYLIKAECLIRTNNVAGGMDLVNEIRKRRMVPYSPLTAPDDVQAMKYLQRTARIEYLYSGKSFFDLKRWNKEGKYPEVVQRVLLGNTFTLASGSPLWVFAFPQSATQYNNTLTQNY